MRTRDRHRRFRTGQNKMVPKVNRAVLSKCGDLKIQGTMAQLVQKYTDLAEAAEDFVQRQMFLQHAEHYRRELSCDVQT